MHSFVYYNSPKHTINWHFKTLVYHSGINSDI
ncbi:unknown [Prevotella sp. CAG:1185]|nr:unknown [Prevotella sp. CAG:1185]